MLSKKFLSGMKLIEDLLTYDKITYDEQHMLGWMLFMEEYKRNNYSFKTKLQEILNKNSNEK